MALLERVATLVRANLNDLIDKAEEPEKMIKQVILDMQNQLLQVKTQVAIAIADQHLLEKKQKENEFIHKSSKSGFTTFNKLICCLLSRKNEIKARKIIKKKEII